MTLHNRRQSDGKKLRQTPVASVLLLLIVAAVAGGVIYANSFHKVLQSGDSVSVDELCSDVFRVRNEEAESPDSMYELVLHVEGGITEADVNGLSLALFRAKSVVFYDVQGNESPLPGDIVYEHLRVLSLKGYGCIREDGAFSLRWIADDFFNPSYMFIGSTQELEAQSTFWRRMQDISIGVMFLMLIYSLSLFVFKREERYLASFAAYVGVTLLMSVLNMGIIKSGGLYDLYNKSIPFLIMMILCVEVSTVKTLLKTRDTWWTKPFSSGLCMVGISLAYTVICLFDVMLLKELSRLIIIVIGFSVVVEGLVHGKRYAPVLFLGYAISEAVNLVPMGINLGFYEDGLPLALFRVGRMYGLPFAFSCMFFINRKLADRFKESEMLAEELESANRTLDARVRERTQATLSQMEKRHSLMLNIFHDLRSPLFTLKGCLQILFDKDETDVAEKDELRKVTMEKLDFMSGLTENLFLLAKIEDDRFLLSCARFDVVPLVKRLADSHRISADAKHIELIENITLESAFVWGDGLRLEQAFDNILKNAVTYTQSGGIIRVDAKKSDGILSVSIADNGIGISKEQLGTIFERYFRVDTTAKTSSGLGLAIAYGVIHRHNGNIKAESVEGEGSVFTVELPLLSEAAVDAKPRVGGQP